VTGTADVVLAVLIPFLIFSATALALMLVFLISQRGLDEFRFQRKRRLTARYRELIDSLLQPGADTGALAGLSRVPKRHHYVIETMLLKPLAVSTGSVVERLREAARATGLIDAWVQRLTSRRWWVRAESVRALGLVRESRSLSLIVRALDDEHEEVRAAAVEALGLIGDPNTIPVLLSKLADQSRNQRARVIEALRQFGDAATPALIAHAYRRADDAAAVADVLGLIGGSVAGAELNRWMASPRADVRLASMRALGSIGLDDTGFAMALQALEDPKPGVRAMAARALGRSRREDSVEFLATHLDDEWTVAANCANALRRLGDAGLDRLRDRADDETYVGDLARQMLWEFTAAEAGV